MKQEKKSTTASGLDLLVVQLRKAYRTAGFTVPDHFTTLNEIPDFNDLPLSEQQELQDVFARSAEVLLPYFQKESQKVCSLYAPGKCRIAFPVNGREGRRKIRRLWRNAKCLIRTGYGVEDQKHSSGFFGFEFAINFREFVIVWDGLMPVSLRNTIIESQTGRIRS